jgi:pyruvate dehydrogenase (quinone)
MPQSWSSPRSPNTAYVRCGASSATRSTLLVGHGAIPAREQVLALADAPGAPMVLTLKTKEGLEQANPFQIGQSGLIGNPAPAKAMDACEVLFLVGTDFPYRDWYPAGRTVLQLDVRREHIGRRTPITHALMGDARSTLQALLPRLTRCEDRSHLEKATKAFQDWHDRQQLLLDPDHDQTLVGKVRSVFHNPGERIRPEAVAAVVDRQAPDSAIFTADTGMSTAWLARYVAMRGTRRLRTAVT